MTGRSPAAGYGGGGLIGSTMVRLAGLRYRFQAVKLTDIQSPPEHGPGWVRFTQTVGGRTGLPAPGRSSTLPTCSGRRRWCGPR